jgi:two-component system, response regulator PdtaR
MATFVTVQSSCPLGPVSDQQFSGVVLLVEDEPLVRLVTADILLEANFRVIEAADAAEALRVLSAEVAVDVLLSDVEMPPGMNGYELARHVHQLRPEVEILISSGRGGPGRTTCLRERPFSPSRTRTPSSCPVSRPRP